LRETLTKVMMRTREAAPGGVFLKIVGEQYDAVKGNLVVS